MVSRFNSVVLNRSVVRLFAYQKRLIYKKRFIKAEEMSSNGCSLLNRPKKNSFNNVLSSNLEYFYENRYTDKRELDHR